MTRLLLIVGGAVALAVIAFVAIVMNNPAGGPAAPAPVTLEAGAPSSTSAPATPPPAEAAASPAAPAEPAPAEPPAPQLAEDAAGRQAFDAWTAAVAPAAVSATAEAAGEPAPAGIPLAGFAIGGDIGTLSWSWASSGARLSPGNGAAFTLNLDGEQTLTVTRGEASATWTGTLDRAEITLDPQPGGNRLRLAAANLRLEGATGRVAVDEAEAVSDLPSGATTTISLLGLRLPGVVSPGLGSGLSLGLIVDLRGLHPGADEPSDIGISSLNVEWGALRASGGGTLGIDAEARPAGEIDMRIPDALAALDAIHVAAPVARDALAETYAVLLQAMASAEPGQPLHFKVRFADGLVELLGGSYGFSPVALATVAPALGLAGEPVSPSSPRSASP